MSLSGLIDVHCHSMTPAYRAALTGIGGVVRTVDWTPQLALDFQERRGIAIGVYSLSTPGVHHGDDAKARIAARRCNEEAVDYVSAHPDRLGAFATLPMPDVEAACNEAAHALDVMQLDGIGLLASYGGRYLGQPEFDPLLAVLDERAATVLIHPTNPPSTDLVRRGISPGIGNFLVEFLFDTTRAALNLVFSGALERFPNIRFILAHAGGTLPFAAWRVCDIAHRQMSVQPWDTQYPSPFMTAHAGQVTPELLMAQFARFWFDTALSAGPQTFGALRHVARSDRILFGSDWPYCPEDMTVDMLAALDAVLAPQEREAIAHRNARTLFPRFALSSSRA